jgi:hypothetical protein
MFYFYFVIKILQVITFWITQQKFVAYVWVNEA